MIAVFKDRQHVFCIALDEMAGIFGQFMEGNGAVCFCDFGLHMLGGCFGHIGIIIDFGAACGDAGLLHFGRNAGASVHNDAAIGRHGGTNGFYALQIQNGLFGIDAVHGAETDGQRIHASGVGKLAGLLRIGKVFTDFGVCQRLSAVAVFAGGGHHAQLRFHGNIQIMRDFGEIFYALHIFLKRQSAAIIHDGGKDDANGAH